MAGIIIGIAGLLCILGVALFTYINRNKEQEAGTPPPEAGCCGAHAVCEKGLKKIDAVIDYFDDEELDELKGIPAESFTDGQLDRFRDVLYTLRKEEIGDWIISLEKREIRFPEALKAEALDLLRE